MMIYDFIDDFYDFIEMIFLRYASTRGGDNEIPVRMAISGETFKPRSLHICLYMELTINMELMELYDHVHMIDTNSGS